MANARDKEDRGGRRPAKRSGPSLALPILIVVVLLGAGAVAVLGGNKAKKEPEAVKADDKPKPFAGLPREEPPKSRGSSGRAFADAPEGLAADATWQRTLTIAAEGEALYDAAVAAKTKGDTPVVNEKGNAAKDKLNEALEMSAVWEEELISKYGETDPQVRAIVRTRSGWFKKLDWLLKSTSR